MSSPAGRPFARPSRRRVFRGLILGLGFVALAPGCLREPAVDLAVPRRHYKVKEYDDVLGRWTRHRRVIKNFDTNLDVHVTYLSPEYVTAHAVVYGKDYRLSKGERQRYLAKRLAEVQGHHEFFMAATTADGAWNDFDRKESIWRLTLEDDQGTRVRPLIIKHLTATQVHRVYFPYVSVFHRVYHVLFPRQVGGKPFITGEARWFKLIIAGPLGDTELAWFLKARQGEPAAPSRAGPPPARGARPGARPPGPAPEGPQAPATRGDASDAPRPR